MRVTEAETKADARRIRLDGSRYEAAGRRTSGHARPDERLQPPARHLRDFESDGEGNAPVSTHHCTNIGVSAPPCVCDADRLVPFHMDLVLELPRPSRVPLPLG